MPTDENLINIGDYIIIKRYNYFKLHQVSSKQTQIVLGKDKVDLSCIIGKPHWTLYKMVAKKNSKREYVLEVCTKAVKLSDTILKDATSGTDNRTIVNDNKSQLLSSEEITEMRDSGLPSANILSALVENSTTFKNKTEYSQVKYLKKKEKKYEDCITVIKPTLRMVSEVLFKRDPQKILGLRFDTLSQMISALNIQQTGVYLLFETGTQGLVAAALLNHCSLSTTVINVTLGIEPQRQAVLAMNYSPEIMQRVLNVRMSNILQLLKGETPEALKKANERINENTSDSVPNEDSRKRSADNSDIQNSSAKKRRWADELVEASKILTTSGVDGFIISCKEYPLALINNFDKYLKPSRNLVIYSAFREPLVELYTELKKKKSYINLHLTETFYRQYQVLPERTHPLVTMSPSGGFLLTATNVISST